jgi:hypothetical protein
MSIPLDVIRLILLHAKIPVIVHANRASKAISSQLTNKGFWQEKLAVFNISIPIMAQTLKEYISIWKNMDEARYCAKALLMFTEINQCRDDEDSLIKIGLHKAYKTVDEILTIIPTLSEFKNIGDTVPCYITISHHIPNKPTNIIKYKLNYVGYINANTPSQHCFIIIISYSEMMGILSTFLYYCESGNDLIKITDTNDCSLLYLGADERTTAMWDMYDYFAYINSQ